MKTTYLTVSAAVLALLVAAPAALAIPPVDDDADPACPPGYKLVDDICVKRIPPPRRLNSPALSSTSARQNTNARRPCASPAGRRTPTSPPRR